MRRPRLPDPSPTAPPAALAAQWAQKLRKGGFRDIEYRDGSLLGNAMQEVARAPHEGEAEAVVEYAARATEFYGATDWRGRSREKRLWHDYIENFTMREIGTRRNMPLTTVHRKLDKLRAECEVWWKSTEEERHNPRPPMGRPRREEPRRYTLSVRLSDRERRTIDAAITRAGHTRSHARRDWCREALLRKAWATPYGPDAGVAKKAAV